MCSPAASFVSGMTASSPTGTKHGRCAAVGNAWASPPIPPHATHHVWCSGCKRSQVSTLHSVRTVVQSHSCGSRCPALLYPLPIEALLWRCPSATRHDPSGFSKAAVVETLTGASAPEGGPACLWGDKGPDRWGTWPASLGLGAHRGP